MATPPLVVEWLSSVTCGEDRSSEIAWFSAWTWLSSCWVWACAKPKSTATTIEAVATTPDSHGTHGAQARVRRGRAAVGLDLGRQLPGARGGGQHLVAQFGRRLGGGGEGQRGGHLAEPAYLAGTRLAAAHVTDETVALGPSLERVQRVGAGERVQVVAEEPHVSSPPGNRASG